MSNFQNELDQARYDAVVNAIAANQAAGDAAQLKYQQAMSIGDMHTASEAQREISRAEARLVQLENGKDAYDEAVTRQQQGGQQQVQQQQQRQQTPAEVIAGMTALTEKERAWLSERPHLVTDQRFITRLQDTFNMAAEKGLQRDSDQYFGLFNERFQGTGGPQGATSAMIDAAKVSGIGIEEYMKQYRKMHADKYDSASLYGVRRA
jgi:hypothetical protein